MRKAFTLAEVMIVLTVIGILTAILMPIAFHSAPDENVMKFKKATTTLGTVVREMVSSDQYFQDGNLSKKSDGTSASSIFVCESMADIVNYKSADCTKVNGTTYTGDPDVDCNTGTKKAQIITADGVQYFLASNTRFSNTNPLKAFCFDVDGVGYGEAPFGFAIRQDGKMFYGARAQTWSSKSVQRGG